MDCCKSNASPRRKALISEFTQFLDQIEESDRGSEGFGQKPNVYEAQRRGGPPAGMKKLPRYPDYMDPSKRPLIASIQVLEYRPTGSKHLLDLKIPDITGVEYCELRDPKPPPPPTPPPGLVDRILANKELGYPSPGEKSPYLYRTPRPIPRDPPPRYPPPPPMDHRAGIPCVICEPPVQSGSMKKCPTIARIDTTRTPQLNCPDPCGKPCPENTPYPHESTDPNEPPVCRKYFVPQPPCVAYYNSPCGVHERQWPCCWKLYKRVCRYHRQK